MKLKTQKQRVAIVARKRGFCVESIRGLFALEGCPPTLAEVPEQRYHYERQIRDCEGFLKTISISNRSVLDYRDIEKYEADRIIEKIVEGFYFVFEK